MNPRPYLLAPVFALVLTKASAQTTSFIRQMAKDGTSIHIVSSGPETQKLAEELLAAIKKHKDWKASDKRKLEIVTPIQLGGSIKSKPKSADETIVMLFVGNEQPILPDEIVGLGAKPELFADTVSRISAVVRRPVKEGLSFRILLTAPDAEREAKLLHELEEFDAPSVRELTLTAEHVTSRMVVHRSPGLTLSWGGASAGEWNHLEECSLSERPPGGEKDPETVSAYLIDRSADPAGLPPALKDLLSTVKPGSVFAKRMSVDRRTCLVLNAPNKGLLENLVARFASPSDVPEEPYVVQMADLRLLTKASLVLNPNLLPAETVDPAWSAAKAMARANGIEVVGERPEGNAADIDSVLNGKPHGSPFALYLDVKDVKGGTEYSGNLERHSDVPADWASVSPWNGVSPVKPDRHANESDDHRRRVLAEWQKQVDDYNAAYDQWQKANIEFLFHSKQSASATLQVNLKIVDLSKHLVVWETSKAGSYTESRDLPVRTLSAQGPANKPDTPELPTPTADCPLDFYLKAVADAFEKDLKALKSEAWLSGNPFGTTLPPPPPPPAPLHILSTENGQATINLSEESDVHVGDLMVATVNGKPVRLRVISIDKTIVCKPVTDTDKSRLPYLKAGTLVKWINSSDSGG